MATALLSGEALTAGELAKVANLSPSAASPHLTRLVEGGLLIVAHQGRHRYYRLADPAVAKVLEAMLTIAPGRPIANLRAEWKRNKLWAARTCYDHLAGMLGVQLYDRMIARGLLSRADGALRVTPVGGAFFAAMGIDTEALSRGRRPLLRECLDWTERRHHLAGALGAALLDHLVGNGSLQHDSSSRAIRVSAKGMSYLRDQFGVNVQDR
jgi:DNA-binding transcriptional ArsR family regulator